MPQFLPVRAESVQEQALPLPVSRPAMSIQVQQKFQSIIELRLSQVSGIIKSTWSEEITYGDDLLEDLKQSAQVRDFSYLALYAGDFFD